MLDLDCRHSRTWGHDDDNSPGNHYNAFDMAGEHHCRSMLSHPLPGAGVIFLFFSFGKCSRWKLGSFGICSCTVFGNVHLELWY